MPFHTYLCVNGVSFSTPSETQAEALSRPLRNSVEHKVSGVATACDYGFITINHYATGMRVYNNIIGETRVTINDMENFELSTITERAKILAMMHKFNKDAQEAPDSIMVMKFTTKAVDHNVEWLARESLSKTPRAAKVAKPQMEDLSKMLLTACDDHPLTFEFFTLPTTQKDKADISTFGASVKALYEYEIAHDPYEMFFSANEQTRRQKTLPLSHVPDISKRNFPELQTQPKHTRYINKEQQIVHQLIGTANDHRCQEFRHNELRGNDFKVAVLPCPHVDDEMRCMMIVIPEGKASLLPQNGEGCRVNPPHVRIRAAGASIGRTC